MGLQITTFTGLQCYRHNGVLIKNEKKNIVSYQVVVK